MKSKTLLGPLLLALVLVLAACGGTEGTTDTGPATEGPAETGGSGGKEAGNEEASEPAPSGEARKSEKVQIVEFTYQPDPVVIQVGGKVVWQNQDTAPHTATADDGSFDTGVIEKGKLGSATFKKPGTFTYFCEIHPTMKGTVVVLDRSTLRFRNEARRAVG